MTGDQHIINLQKKRKTPEWVFINDYPCKAPTDDFHPNVCVFGDHIESLDLRFLVNLKVSAASAQESRCKALLNACKRHSVALVAVACVDGTLNSNGFTEIWTGGIPN